MDEPDLTLDLTEEMKRILAEQGSPARGELPDPELDAALAEADAEYERGEFDDADVVIQELRQILRG